MRIDNYRMSYLSMLLDLTEVKGGERVYLLERVHYGGEDFWQIIFNSPKGVKVCLTLEMRGNLVAQDASIVVRLGQEGEFIFTGNDTKDIAPANLRKLVERAIDDLYAEGSHLKELSERTYGEVKKEKDRIREAATKERQRHWRDEL